MSTHSTASRVGDRGRRGDACHSNGSSSPTRQGRGPCPVRWRTPPFLRFFEGVSDLLISSQRHRPNSYRLMKRPITRSCMVVVLEKQIVRRTSRLIRVRKLICLLSMFACAVYRPRAAQGRDAARRHPTHQYRSDGSQKAQGGLAAAETPHPAVAQRRTPIRCHSGDRWHATATAVPLSCRHNSTSHRALTSSLGVVPAPPRDKSRPRRGLGAGAAIPPDSPGRAQVPFF